MKRVTVILGIIIAMGTIIGGVLFYDDRVAKAIDLKEAVDQIEYVDNRLEQKIIEDRVSFLQQRIWKYEDRYGGPGVPNALPHEREEYRFLKTELEREQRKLKK